MIIPVFRKLVPVAAFLSLSASLFAQADQGDFPSPPNQQVLDRILELKNAGKSEDAIKFLGEELDRRADAGGRYGGLYVDVWREAQVRSGRVDADWGARLYNQLFVSCEKHGKFKDMDDVMGNLLANLGAAGRHGRKTEILEWWAKGQRPPGKQLDIASYKDLGPALPFLPQVRLRDVPEDVLYWRANAERSDPIPAVNLGQLNSQLFDHYADHFGKSGRWVESMEWHFQMRRWSSKEDGSPKWQLIQSWFGSVESIANWLRWHGFYEEALTQVDQGLASDMQESYHGRKNILFNLTRLLLLIDLDQAPDDIVDQAESLAERAKVNKHLGIGSYHWARVVIAKAMLHKGRDAEALAILDELSEIGVTSAREARLTYWINHGQFDRVEEELLSLLKASREAGNKSSEAWLYEMYADFLEATGRLDEALAMRREVIRLYKSFNHFTKLPIQLAKLALLLERMGDPVGSSAAAAEARALLAQNNLPKGRLSQAMDLLAKLGTLVADDDSTDKKPEVDFQPERSLVFPIKGAAWTTLLTLANPSGDVREGTLSSEGLPLKFTRDENGDLELWPAEDAKQGQAVAQLRLEPQSYELIRISADENFAKEGEIKLTWNSSDGKSKAEAQVQILEPEKGVSSSIIQAGNYRTNAFYGVPVYLHYVTKEKVEQSSPLRFVTSQAARVEVYAMDGAPLSVDAQGNGSLWDKGDELYGASDREGNLKLSLVKGAVSFMVLLYPEGPLPEEGLTLKVEVQQGREWVVNSENKLMP